MYKIIHHYKIFLRQYSTYVHAKQKIRKSDPIYISLLLYNRVAEAHRWFSKLYGGDFNRFTTLVMVDLSVGATLVSSFKANSNRTFVLFGSGFFWNKFEVEL